MEQLIEYLKDNDVEYKLLTNSIVYQGMYHWYVINRVDVTNDNDIEYFKKQINNNLQH